MKSNLSTDKNTNIKKVNTTSKVDIPKILIYIGLFLLAVLCFLPFYFMMINATHSNADIARNLNLLPGTRAWINYQTMSERINIWRGFLNSIIITCSGTALLAYFGTATAYGFSKFKFPGSKALFWVILSTMMVPPQLGVIGFYDVVFKLGLLDNFLALILPMMANAQFVFFVKQYMDSTLPKSILESARIDGASEVRIFNKIVLPLSTPAIATMGMFAFIFQWNQLLIPQVVLRSSNLRTVPILVANARGIYRTDFAPAYMAVSLSVIPLIIVFLFFSKHIIGGLTAGAVKG
ncbi:carbohydrate ABC transporter permease [Herbivorax sp. ANBcel31]|uniref:carbohydrate ABC transporter permease n=1 Tax=Herbivorax sp. ANBcel31 TaxID=3069754 RepID=UPI0027B60C95|nr:carbohydrate ABC transporter permease [Herbivorax sp. ANBcel31]MDQ2085484.1 carbohydrate ABC transporter permease [Herbivorax sp. ANBcel31]